MNYVFQKLKKRPAWNSSRVERTKVAVDTTTTAREKNAAA